MDGAVVHPLRRCPGRRAPGGRRRTMCNARFHERASGPPQLHRPDGTSRNVTVADVARFEAERPCVGVDDDAVCISERMT